MVVAAASEADNLSCKVSKQHVFQAAETNQKRWKEKYERLLEVRNDLYKRKDNVCLCLPGYIYQIITLSDSSNDSSNNEGGENDSKDTFFFFREEASAAK